MFTAKSFFDVEQQEAIKQAIVEAERNTSGEIRVHIDNECTGEAMHKAVDVFAKLKMHETELRNGVLIYLAVKDKKFAILGDAGINIAVPLGFWDTIREQMAVQFKKGEFVEGLCEAILASGNQLKKHFPYKKNDINELNNDISFGK